jgi:cohesin complex subunit SA-1/2
VEALHASLEAIFNGVLVHRFRDVFAPIRAEVMRYLGEWVLEYPQHFLQNKYAGGCCEGFDLVRVVEFARVAIVSPPNRYLKYIGWLLKDRDAAVRMSSLEATLALLRNEDCAPEMNALVTRFRDRLIEMTQDVDSNVAVLAYHVLVECSKYDAVACCVSL